MRLLARLAAVSVFAATATLDAQGVIPAPGPQVTRSSQSFSTSALEFFGAAGLTGRYQATGCTVLVYQGQSACAEVTIETGIEAATGAGAVRALVTRLTSNAADLPAGSLGVRIDGGAPRDVFGTLFRSSLPGTARQLFPGALDLTERVQRNGVLSGDSTYLHETFVPTDVFLSLVFQYRDYREGGARDCFTANRICTNDSRVRFGPIANITAVPEPSTYALLGTGLLTLGTIAARRRKRAEG